MSETKQAETQKWTVEHDADGDFVIFEHTEIVAITNSDTPKDEARALLISKAPEMADLLREAMGMINGLKRNVASYYVERFGQNPSVTYWEDVDEFQSRLEALLSTLEKI